METLLAEMRTMKRRKALMEQPAAEKADKDRAVWTAYAPLPLNMPQIRQSHLNVANIRQSQLNKAHIRQSQPDSGLVFQVKVLETG